MNLTVSLSPRATTPRATFASSGKHVRCADDVHHVDPPRRLVPELKHAVDRVGEGVRLQLLSVAEPEATAERERVGLEVGRDLPAPDHLGLQRGTPQAAVCPDM